MLWNGKHSDGGTRVSLTTENEWVKQRGTSRNHGFVYGTTFMLVNEQQCALPFQHS